MSVGFEHHQETHVPDYGNGSISTTNDARGDSGSHLGSPSTSLTFPHLRHHHHSHSHGSNGSSPTPLLHATSSTSSFSNITSSRSRLPHPRETSSLARGAYGESETFSAKNNRFSPLSSSPSQTSTSLWTSSARDNSLGNMTTHHHQHHHHYNSFQDQDHHHGNSLGTSKFSFANQFQSNNANSTYKTFAEQIVDQSVVQMSSYKNFSDEMETLQSEDNVTTTFFINGTSSGDVAGSGINSTSDSVSIRGNLYASIVPVMLFFCVLAVLVNLIIVISARWCRKPMSPTLYFSISLALADAYAAFILATGLVINSLLPYVFGYSVPVCLSLVVEAFRQGGVLVTVSHLLALAMNHWIGIVRPLHYAATMTRRTAWIVIILSWICPITIIFFYYSIVSGEGFQSPGCTNYNFLKERAYRAFFASCFFAPLILMSFIYIHIFIIVRNHHTHRQRYQNTQQLKRNVKAVLTTMLVLGTYIIGWLPAILFSLIACNNCVYDTESLSSGVRYSFGFITNLLVILKTLVDPVIYAARMIDIQTALKKMRYDILATFCKSCAPAAPPNDRGYYLNSPSARTCSKFNRSFYETKSMRMSSFGSRSSSRRLPNNAGNASLIHHPNGNQIHHNLQSHKQLSQPNGAGGNGYVPCATESYASTRPNPHPNTNGSSRRSFIQNNQPQALINSKSAFEMTEMN